MITEEMSIISYMKKRTLGPELYLVPGASGVDTPCHCIKLRNIKNVACRYGDAKITGESFLEKRAVDKGTKKRVTKKSL